VGEDPLAREQLYSKLNYATRFIYTDPGWFGGFDNCLWDIAGKVAGLPVARLIGGSKPRCRAYYCISGQSEQELIEDAERAIAGGYTVLKDHLGFAAGENKRLFKKLRDAVGPDVGLLHDAALANYTFEEALSVGRCLEELDFGWLEEPLPDRHQEDYIRLSARLDIPIAGPETFMHDVDLSALWLRSGAVKLLRVNARHGTTPVLKLAHFAELFHTTVEPNTFGPLCGLVHAHLACGIENIRLFEVLAPGGIAKRAERIGLTNPVVPDAGWVTWPDGPGWGAEWDWRSHEKNRVAVL
jgi:L-alanine-DL-glutamate epimerase-like enolase superfamily enzyme